MASITHALRQIKANLGDVLSEEHIAQVCRESGHTWRIRLLDPIATIHVFILQVLHGNTATTQLPRPAGRSLPPRIAARGNACRWGCCTDCSAA